MQSRRWCFVALALLGPLTVPPLVFLAVGISKGMSAIDALGAMLVQYGARQVNLLVVGLLGLFPVLLLLAVLWLHRRSHGAPAVRRAISWGGLLPILAVLVWVNIEFWSAFLPARTNPGFPHGLEFVIGPSVFAPVAMTLGALGSWLVSRAGSDSGTLTGGDRNSHEEVER